MRFLACLLALALAPLRLAAADAKPGVKTVIVVRHAEADAAPAGADAPLGTIGQARALELLRVLGDTPLRSVYSTHYQRNRQTAEPLARRAGGKLTIIDDVAATLEALRAEPWGATALVVGHSNTVPDLVRGLTGQGLPDNEPVTFDRMWVVTLARDGAVSVLRLRYGAPAAPSPH